MMLCHLEYNIDYVVTVFSFCSMEKSRLMMLRHLEYNIDCMVTVFLQHGEVTADDVTPP